MTDKREPERAPTRDERLASREHLGDETPAPAQGGVSGGTLQGKVGKRDEEKRAFERPAGATRVTKADEKD